MKTKSILLLKLFVLLLLVVGSGKCLFAQAPADAYFTSVPDTNGTMKGTMHVLLSDTINITAIEVKLGSTEGSADLVNYTFGFDIITGLPAGYLWTREGFKVTLPVGNMPGADLQFGRVRLQKSDSSWGDTFAFVTN